METFHSIESMFHVVVWYCILVLETIGVLVLVAIAIKSVVGLITSKPHVRSDLAKGIALALEFKLGSEVLHTVVVRELKELVLLGGIILMRAALTLLIHWELKNEK